MSIDWKTRVSWDSLVEKCLLKTVGANYKTIIKSSNLKIKYRDDYNIVFKLFSGYSTKEQIRSHLFKELRRKKFISAYHGCRATNVESYYKNGILTLDLKVAQNQFKSILYSSSLRLTDTDIETAIQSVSPSTREGYCYLLLDDREFVDGCGHYLIYGSEYLNCLAVHLPNGGDWSRDILKNTGKATIICCSIPIEWIDINDLSYLADRMIAEHIYAILHETEDVGLLNFSVISKQIVSPNMVKSHYHPEKIIDPYTQRWIWNDSKKTYQLPKYLLE